MSLPTGDASADAAGCTVVSDLPGIGQFQVFSFSKNLAVWANDERYISSQLAVCHIEEKVTLRREKHLNWCICVEGAKRGLKRERSPLFPFSRFNFQVIIDLEKIMRVNELTERQ